MPELTQAYLTWKYELSGWSMSLSSFQLLLSNLLSIKHVMTILQQDFSLPHPPTINFQLDLTSLAAAALIIATFQK